MTQRPYAVVDPLFVEAGNSAPFRVIRCGARYDVVFLGVDDRYWTVGTPMWWRLSTAAAVAEALCDFYGIGLRDGRART